MSTLLRKLPWFLSGPLVVVLVAAFAYVGYAFTGDLFHETCLNERNPLTGEFEPSNCGEGAEVAARLAGIEAVIALGSDKVQVVQAGAPPTTVPPPPTHSPTNVPAPSPQPISAAPEPSETPVVPEPSAPPPSKPAAAPTLQTGVIASGSFRNGAPGHNGSGTVQAQRLADGKVNLFLSNFSVTNGPDLYVVLSTNAAGDYTDGDFLVARLKANNGSQNYPLPAGADLARYRSVSIWCKSFDVVFAYAPLAVQ